MVKPAWGDSGVGVVVDADSEDALLWSAEQAPNADTFLIQRRVEPKDLWDLPPPGRKVLRGGLCERRPGLESQVLLRQRSARRGGEAHRVAAPLGGDAHGQEGARVLRRRIGRVGGRPGLAGGPPAGVGCDGLNKAVSPRGPHAGISIPATDGRRFAAASYSELPWLCTRPGFQLAVSWRTGVWSTGQMPSRS